MGMEVERSTQICNAHVHWPQHAFCTQPTDRRSERTEQVEDCEPTLRLPLRLGLNTKKAQKNEQPHRRASPTTFFPGDPVSSPPALLDAHSEPALDGVKRRGTTRRELTIRVWRERACTKAETAARRGVHLRAVHKGTFVASKPSHH
jgi:hypothetical protein